MRLGFSWEVRNEETRDVTCRDHRAQRAHRWIYCYDFGLGGFWGWIELDQGGTGDAAVSGCAHGLPGVPHGGAGGGPLEVTWTATTTNGDPFLTDPGGNYLFVPQVGLTFPATAGHYSSNVFGTVIQVQVVKIPGR